MATDPPYQKISAAEFLAMDFGTDRRFELVDGVIHMMTGGTLRHGHIAGNIYFALRQKLGDGRCRPFNSDVGIQVGPTTVRYPDVSVICSDDWLRQEDVEAIDDPVVIIEVLSPSTTSFDQGTKLDENEQLTSVQTVASVDPVNRLTRVRHRIDARTRSDTSFAKPQDIELPTLGIVLTQAETFHSLPW